jgi:magnesium transporter
MPRLTKSRSRKAGLPPGSLVHIGERHRERPRMTLLSVGPDGVEERAIATVSDCPPRVPGLLTWLNFDAMHDPALLREIGARYGLHPLVLEDILNTDQRAKIEDYGEYLYIVLRLFRHTGRGQIEPEQLSLIIGADFVLSFQEGLHDDFEPLRERLLAGRERLPERGVDFLAYLLLDAAVDGYFHTLEQFDADVTRLEEQLISGRLNGTLSELHRRRRELIVMFRAVWPLREVLGQLVRSSSMRLSEATRLHLRDVQDHVLYAVDTLETLREMLTGLLETHLALATQRANEVIRVLTVIATVFMPATLVASIYGMNFKFMPELDWPLGYPLALVAMVLVTTGMLWFFRRRKWW